MELKLLPKASGRGFSLLEVLVATGILGLLIVAIFSAFDYGSRAFRQANARQDAQGVSTRVYTLLRDDLRQTHHWMASVSERALNIDDTEYRRDGLCFGTLEDWSDPESFDQQNGVPEWDRYVLYYGTLDGKLARTMISHPTLDDHSPAPFTELEVDRYMKDDPATNTGHQSEYRVLTDSLMEFKAETSVETGTVSVRCLFQRDRRERKERSEFQLQVFPQNTWPKGGQ